MSDGHFLVCVSPGRDSPPANEASEEAEEPMAVPEDLSASSTHQQNNRGDKGTRLHPYEAQPLPVRTSLMPVIVVSK